MMIKRIVLPLLLLVSISNPLMAQEVSASKRADIRALLKLTDDSNSYAKQFASMTARTLIPQLAKQPGYTPRVGQVVHEELVAVFSEGMAPAGGLSEKIENAYAKNYSDQEVKDLLKFFQSPTGKKFVSTGPALTKDIVSGAESWTKGVSPMINARITDRLKKEGLEKSAAPAPATTPAPAPAAAPKK